MNQKIFILFIEFLSWILIFLSPVLFCVLLFFILYSIYENASFFYIIFVGIIAGILLAETIRKKKGCSNFLGDILRTPDLEK